MNTLRMEVGSPESENTVHCCRECRLSESTKGMRRKLYCHSGRGDAPHEHSEFVCGLLFFWGFFWKRICSCDSFMVSEQVLPVSTHP